MGRFTVQKFFMIMALVSSVLLPSTAFSGGELSGGGGSPLQYRANHTFINKASARRFFDELEPAAAYWAPALEKQVFNIRFPGTSQYFNEQEICLDGDSLRTLQPDPATGKPLQTPLHWIAIECLRWRVDRKDEVLPRSFTSLPQARRYAEDSRQARGEPYCLDEDYGPVEKQAPQSYLVKFYADVRGEDKEYELGRYRFRFFSCDQLENIEAVYQNYVSQFDIADEDWIQLAGGELSGGGRPRRVQ